MAEAQVPPTDSPADPALVRLLNGIHFAAGASGAIDLNDPMAVLAVMLVAGGTDEIRRRAAKRDELVQKLPARSNKAAPDATPQGLSARLAAVRKQLESTKNDLEKRQRESTEAKGALAQQQSAFAAIEATRQKLSAVLWWLGIGWLIWNFGGSKAAHAAAAEAVQAAGRKSEEATTAEQSCRRAIEALEAEITAIVQLQKLDAEPLALLNSFGWSHVPMRVETLEPAMAGRLVFTHLWNPNCEHKLSDIPGGLDRVDALRQSIDSLSATPVLLSPTSDASPHLRGLLGEEMLLARQIDSLADLVGDAEETHIHAALLPADAAATAQLNAWRTGNELASDAVPYSHRRDFDTADQLMALARQVKSEVDQPELNIAKRLEGLAATLRHRAEDYSKWRHTSVDTLLGRTLDEWRRWSMLPLLRRYCPSYHKSPAYRYHRLGLLLDPKEAALDPPPHPASLIVQPRHEATIKKLPDGGPIEKKVAAIREAEKARAPASEIAAMQQEVMAMVRHQVEGGDIVALSPAAVLRYNTAAGGWHCGLCTHECRIGGKGTPEERVGCPERGLFTDEEASMAEQYVQYEDLLVPMLSALWTEKTTYDEKNRIVREKEAELRRNVLEEEEALRKEALYFKEAARDRVVRVEDVQGQAQEVFARLEEQVESAALLNAIDPMRRRELLDKLNQSRTKLGTVATIKLKAEGQEEDLTARVAQVTVERTVVLDEKVRRASDAPHFVETRATAQTLLFVSQVRAIEASAVDSTSALLKIRRRDTKMNTLVIPRQFQTWVENLTHPGEAEQYEIFDDQSKSWLPLADHTLFKDVLPSAERRPAAFTQPPLPDDDDEAPPLPQN